MSSKKLNPFKDFQSDQIQRSSRKIFTAHYACRNDALNLTPVTGTTNEFIFQIINSLIESWGVRLSWFDCKPPTIPLKPSRYTLRKDDSMICHNWKFCKDITFGHVLFTDLYHYMRIFHALIKLSINCFPSSFLYDSVKITWCVFNKTMYYNYQSRWMGIWALLGSENIFSHQSSEFQKIIIKI